jgi:hypothetical protein
MSLIKPDSADMTLNNITIPIPIIQLELVNMSISPLEGFNLIIWCPFDMIRVILRFSKTLAGEGHMLLFNAGRCNLISMQRNTTYAT